MNNCLLEPRFSRDKSYCSAYENSTGISEYFITLDSDSRSRFDDTLSSLHALLCDAYRSFGLSTDTHVFSRLFFSDIRNQKQRLLGSDLYRLLRHSACSFIQQPPLNGGDLSILIYHVDSQGAVISKQTEARTDHNLTSIHGNSYALHYSCNLAIGQPFDSYRQTEQILGNHCRMLSKHSMDITNNTVRTWLFVNDIENSYQGMVEARKVFFQQWGLTPQTHYIASTGIEGEHEDPTVLVAMDALSIENISPAQITHLEAPRNLNRTDEYGVTFERGTKIQFGDRAHYHISGTASIDQFGEVVHLHDIQKQTQRTVDNINALLEPDSLSINNLAYLIVYIRNGTHYSYVKDVLKSIVRPDIPQIFVRAKVCRPDWLVEIEGFGVTDSSADFPRFL